MKSIVLPNGRTFSYQDELLSYEDLYPMSEEDGKILLSKVKQLFEKKGIFFYLAYGTLLGAVRDHGIIKGDEDLDVCTDNEELLLNSLEYLDENGLKLVRVNKHCTYSFKYGGNSYIDVYIMREISRFSIWSRYCYSLANNSYNPKSLFQGYQDIEFLGQTYKCPKNPERILEFWYGESWRTPVKGHKFLYEVKSHYYWKYFCNIIKAVSLTLIFWPFLRTIHHGYYHHKLQESLQNWKFYLKQCFSL